MVENTIESTATATQNPLRIIVLISEKGAAALGCGLDLL